MRVFTTGRFWANRMLLFRIAGFAVGLVLVVKLFFKVKVNRPTPSPSAVQRGTYPSVRLSPAHRVYAIAASSQPSTHIHYIYLGLDIISRYSPVDIAFRPFRRNQSKGIFLPSSRNP